MFVLSVMVPAPVIAEPALTTPQPVKNDCQGQDIRAGAPQGSPQHCGILDYLVIFIRILTSVAGVVIVMMVIVGGIQYSASRDNPQATAAAKSRIFSAILALIVYLFGFAFLQYIVPGGIF